MLTYADRTLALRVLVQVVAAAGSERCENDLCQVRVARTNRDSNHQNHDQRTKPLSPHTPKAVTYHEPTVM